MSISWPNSMFDHLLESSHRDDSNKWSNIGFGHEIMELSSIEVYFTHLILSSEQTREYCSKDEWNNKRVIGTNHLPVKPLTGHPANCLDPLFMDEPLMFHLLDKGVAQHIKTVSWRPLTAQPLPDSWAQLSHVSHLNPLLYKLQTRLFINSFSAK